MQKRSSIQDVIEIFETGGSYPIRVICDDLEDWVCKYDRTTLNLFYEYLAYCFGKIWGLRMPDIAQVSVHEHHIPMDMRSILQPHLFQKVCFGSKYLEKSELITLAMLPSFQNWRFRKRIRNKFDFLKIALFDIWLANEDRNCNNFNLLLEWTENKSTYFVCPIDHVMLFNSVHLERPPYLLSEDETIINTPLAVALFKTDRKLEANVQELLDNFYLCTEKAERELTAILELVPSSWNIEVSTIQRRLKQHIFSAPWKDECALQFRTLVHQFLLS
jgi:hypothetical protein